MRGTVAAQDLLYPSSDDPGRHDRIVDNRAAERFFNDCPAQPKRLMYVENAGHMLPLDQGWEKLVNEAAGFFKEPRAH